MTINNKHKGFGPAVIIDDEHTYIFLFDSYKNYLNEWGLTKSWKYDWSTMTQDHYKMVIKEISR